jgi:Glycoside hydrolase 123, catalytic domain/Glycoside hydrolase 123 N-terminal domain
MALVHPGLKKALYCLSLLFIFLPLAASQCVKESSDDGKHANVADTLVPGNKRTYPAYHRAGLMPLRQRRWDAIPGHRRQEFSFNTRLFPFQEPTNPDALNAAAWKDVPAGLHGSFVSTEKRYPANTPPGLTPESRKKLSGWKGEKVGTQLLLWSLSEVKQVRWRTLPFRNGEGVSGEEDWMKINFIRFVLSDDGSQGGSGPPPEGSSIEPDVLDNIDRFDLPARSVRPLWVSIKIPESAEEGLYRGEIIIEAENGASMTFAIDLEVLPHSLPPPSEWSFHLDLWQNPWAVARYHSVQPWTPEHMSLLRPLIRMLAEAGQKCISATIIDRPWGGQTYDAYGSMVEWIKLSDGCWRYDYAIFDKYVEFCMDLGISEQISCYSVISWSGYTYFDQSSGEYKTLSLGVGSPEYNEHWKPFLQDFVRHLKQKGWFERAVFAIDEAPLEKMQKFIGFLRTDAPELKIALAGGYHPEILEDIHNWCYYIDQDVGRDVLAQRQKQSRPSTFYVCCGPDHPNTFVSSPPAEAVWLGWYAAARGFDGFLRWAYNSWPVDPMVDSRYISWPAGDCFMVYPGARSSIRFERLREGIQDYEKIRLLRQQLIKSTDGSDRDKLERLDAFLATFSYDEDAGPRYYIDKVRAGKKLLEKLSR